MSQDRPLITLTTDFGLADGTVGAMIGVIKSICPSAEVVNLASDVPAHDIVRGAWALFQASAFYPPDTIHLAVVDPGVGTDRRALAAFTERGTFLGPDNGVLTWALRGVGEVHHRELSNPAYRLVSDGVTFDGRDVFAPAAAYLAAGIDPAELGPVIGNPMEVPWPEPDCTEGRIAGEIVVVDRFGNLISNIPRAEVQREFGDCPVAIRIGPHHAGGLVRGYADITGSLGTVVNGAGLLEIAGNRCSAAEAAGLGRGEAVFVTLERDPG